MGSGRTSELFWPPFKASIFILGSLSCPRGPDACAHACLPEIAVHMHRSFPRVRRIDSHVANLTLPYARAYVHGRKMIAPFSIACSDFWSFSDRITMLRDDIACLSNAIGKKGWQPELTLCFRSHPAAAKQALILFRLSSSPSSFRYFLLSVTSA